MKKYIILPILLSYLFTIDLNQYECNISKLSNISSNRALTTLKAVGYYTIEHQNIYVEDEITNKLQPEEFDLELAEGIFIIDIPDSESSSLNSTENDTDDTGFYQYLSGVSMSNSTDSDPIERIMVCYDKESPDLYRSFLDILYNQLDVPAKQILIEALVVEINSDDLSEVGLSNSEFSQNNGDRSISSPTLGDPTSTPFSIFYSETDSEILQDMTSITDAVGDPVSTPLINSEETGYITADIQDFVEFKLSALISEKSAEILSRPSILVLDGRQARIQVGQQIPITKLPVSSYSGDEILIPDIEYLPVGIVLNIKPRISNNLKNITMQVETIITETENFSSGVLEAPIINNRKVESFVRVSDNTPFIIGGLISNKKSDSIGKIPLLWKIPWLGKLFTWEGKQNVKKEVIVVITPHIIEDNNDNFSRVIPQDAVLFDSFDNKLFPNSYRLKESDIYDLNFITESSYLNSIQYKALASDNLNENQKEIVDQINNGYIPGEDIITQRMIYDIIEKQNYHTSVNSNQIIFFNHNKNNTVDKLSNYFPIIDDPRRAILISINNEISDNQNFFRPSMNIEEIILTEQYNYKELYKNYWLENKNSKPLLITNQKNLKRLYEVLVLQEVLKLNGSLDFSINEFRRGLQLQFPAKEIIMNNTFVIDEKIADYFYQVNFYYESFEEEFENKTKFLSK